MSNNDRMADGQDQPWFLYIVECSDGSLYTGITNDIERRKQQHNDGTASRYKEICGSRSQALIRECSVKLLSRKEKVELVKGRK